MPELAGGGDPPIRLIQTADADSYKVLFDITAPASRRFCELHGVTFMPFIGIKRGCHPWHAAFNRIVMVADLIDAGYRGWVIYLDADAYPYDLRFDLRGYLQANRHWGIIAAAGGTAAFMPNTGIMLLNLAVPAARDAMQAWKQAFDRVLPDARLNAAASWIEDDDQALLHPILHRQFDYATLVKIEPFALMGWPRSSFLRQHLRKFSSFRERCELARAGVAEAFQLAGEDGAG